MNNIFNYTKQGLTPTQNLDLIRSVIMNKKCNEGMKIVSGKSLSKKKLVKKCKNGWKPSKKGLELINYEY